MLPTAPESEREILSAILFDPTCIPDVRRVVRPVDFHDRQYSAIYSAAIDAFDRGLQPDAPIVIASLRNDGHAAAEDIVCALAEDAFTAANVAYHARAVRDVAGRRELIRNLQQAAVAAADPNQSVQSVAQAAQAALLPVAVTSDDGVGFRRPDYWRVAQEIEARGQRALPGLTSGFAEIDRHTNGWRPGELIIIGGTPKLGKSTLAMTIAQRVSRAGPGVLVCSAEMTADQLTERLLNAHAAISTDRTSTGNLSDAEGDRLVRSAQVLGADLLFIDDEPTPQLSDLVARCVAHVAAYPDIKLIIVDFLQLVRVRMNGRRGDEELEHIAYGLKALAKKTGCVVVAPVQLNHREADSRSDPRPVLRDIAGSSGILKAADMVALAYRPVVHDSSAPADLLELTFAASRRTPTFAVKLHWDGARARVLDRV